MHSLRLFSLMLFCSHLISCSAVQLPVTNQYRLQAFDTRALQSSPSAHRTLLISQPEAAEGYQTEQMLYVDKPFQLSAFAGNAWVSTPANMLFPLLIQSFQASRAFSAIASSPYPNQVDYRLDTQVIAMQQNFLTTPSQLELTLKIVLTHVKNNTILFSTILTETVTCTSDTPYGGVVAANQAIQTLTGKIKRQVIRAIKANESE